MKILYQGLVKTVKKSNKNWLNEELKVSTQADFRHVGVKIFGLEREWCLERKFYFLAQS